MKRESLRNILLFVFIFLNIVGVFYNGTIFILKMGDFERAILRIIYSIVALGCFIIFSNIQVKWLLRKAPLFFFFCLVLMALVFVPGLGETRFGATRWLSIPPFSWVGISIQPAEITKLGLVLFLSCILGQFFEMRSREESSLFCSVFYQRLHWSRYTTAIFFSLILLFLTVYQKDLTMIAFYIVLFIALSWMYGINVFKIILLLAVLGVPIVYFVLNDSNRMARLTSFRDVENNRLDKSFQLYNSLLAVGSGGLYGKGINRADQLQRISEVENDFILACIAEETGFIGTTVLITFYLMFFLTGMYLVFKLNNFSYQLLAFGLVLIFTLQALIHFIVVLGIGPTTGIPLPLVSYGGTSLAVFGCLFGILHQLAGEIR